LFDERAMLAAEVIPSIRQSAAKGVLHYGK